MKNAFKVTTLAALLLSAVSAQAAVQIYSFSGELDSGHFMGETFSGSFSYDDASLTGLADEWLAVSSLSMNFLGNAYTLVNADVVAEVGYYDGAFLGLSYSVSSGDPQFSLIAGNFDASDAFFAYDTDLGLSGAGNVIYAPVPEPETWAMLLLGLGLVGMKLRNRNKSLSIN